MKKRCVQTLVSIFMFIVIPKVLSAQDFDTFYKVEVGINGMGLALDIPVSDKITIEPAIGFGPSYDLSGDGYGITEKLNYHWALFQPSVHGSVYGKYFYNKTKRENKNKSLWLNSGRFIGLKVKYVSKSLSDPRYYSNTILTNLNWGGQFNWGKHWTHSYSLGIGYGYNMDSSYGLFYPALDLKIAYVLPFFGKRKANR